MISTGEKVVAIALSYVGATRGSVKQKELIKAFNKVKPHGYTARTSDPWCAEAWTAWQILAGNTQKDVPMSASCTQIIADAKKLGIWIENDAFKPSRGDAILYDWQDSGKGDNTGAPDHIGTVYDVDSKYIYVVEGNKGSSSVCGKRAIARNGKFIRGFVHPHYADEKPITSVDVDGSWGYYTTMLSQKVFGTTQDGVVSGQTTANKKYLPNCQAGIWSFSKGGGGSQLIKAIQKVVGTTVDGHCGINTVKAVQKYLKNNGFYKGDIDGYMKSGTVKAWQKWLNTNPKPKAAKTNTDKILSKAKELAWAKGTKASKYAWKGGAPTDAFAKALNKVYPDRKSWGEAPKKGCACDVYVGTVVNSTGIVSDFPRGCNESIKYRNKAFERYEYHNVAPYDVSREGDIIAYYKKADGSSKHTLIRGNGVLYEAQLRLTYGHVNKSMSKIKTKRPYVVILRAK